MPISFIESWRHTWNSTQFNPMANGADDGFGNLIPIWGTQSHYAAHTFLYNGMFGFDIGMSFPIDQRI